MPTRTIPTKRGSPSVTSEAGEQYSAASRRGSSKRLRLSTGDTDTASVSGLSYTRYNTEDIFPSTQDGRQGTVREAYESARDEERIGGDEDEEDDEAAIERQTQELHQRNRSVGENREADSGVLESVTCINFMCHNKLHVQLGPLINFIIGHNGSGKSAVLTAISLCLGAKATSTNRGQSLKAFVKQGQETATLIVKIRNRGSGPYRHDVFGDSIIVERHFSVNGASGFKLKGVSGKIVSTKKEELEAITDHYAMQLDNPINVLNQDQARQFLNSSSSVEKYKFFIKGVCLEQLDKDYTVLSESLDQTDVALDRVRERVTNLKNASEEAKRQLDKTRQLTSLNEKISNLTRQIAWVQVEAQEGILADVKRHLEESESNILTRQEAARDAERRFEEAKIDMEKMESYRNETKDSLDDLRSRKSPVQEQLNDIEARISNYMAEGRTANGDKKVADDSLRKAEADLQEEINRIEAATGGARSALVERIKDAEEEIENLRSKKLEHESNTLPACQREKQQSEIAAQAAEEPVKEKREAVENQKRQLKQMQQKGNQQDAGYPPDLKKLLDAIERERGFRDKPVGPIGRYIKLLNPDWSPLLESLFGGTLNSFIVTNKSDQVLLTNTLKRMNWPNVQVFIGNAQRMHRPDLEPDPKFLAILNVIECDNDLVRNTLIINHMVDKTILIKDPREARRVMFEGEPVRNVQRCVTMRPSGDGDYLAYGRGRTQKSDFMKRWDGRPRMRTDAGSQLRLLEDHITSLQNQLGVLESQLREKHAMMKTSREAAVRAERRNKDLQSSLQSAQDSLDTLQEELEEATPRDGSLDALKAEVEEKKHRQTEVMRQLDLWKESMAELEAQKKTVEPKLERFDHEIGNGEDDLNAATRRFERAQRTRENVLKEKNLAFEQIGDAQRNRDDFVKQVEDQETQVATFIEQARSISERVAVDDGETYDTLERKYENARAQKERAQREMGGDERTLARNFNDARASYLTAKKTLTDLDGVWHKLSHSLKYRQERWRAFRSSICARARVFFMYLLAERGMHGQLRISHSSKALELRVRPQAEGTGRNGGSEIEGLSGGERSFSQICFLLSIWDSLGSPVRCLDEFDVFMDSVNRSFAMKLIIEACRSSVGKQSILISPQAMGNLDVAPDVKIIKLMDPERGQTILPGA